MATGKSGVIKHTLYNDYYISQHGYSYVDVYYEEEYDVSTNSSVIKVTKITFSHSKYGGSWSVYGTVTIDGTAYNFSSTIGSGGTITNPITSNRIYHDDATGEKTISISTAVNTVGGSGGTQFYSGNHGTANVTVVLTTIPRKSSLTASNGVLGTAQTLTINRKSSNYAHSIRYKCGTSDVALVTKTTSTSISFTPPLTLAKQNTTGASVSITFTLYTFASTANDAKEIGTSTHTITCSIPDSVKPSCSLSVADVTGHADTFGGYVQGQSKLEIIVTPTLAYESPIASYSVSADGKTYGYSDIETPPLTNSGTLSVSATVKDQRGRSGSASKSITVLPYSPPAVSRLAVARCNSDGSANDMGTHCKVTYSFAITSLSSKNAKTIKLKYKKTSETSYTTVSLTSAYSATNATYVFAADESASYNVALEIEDSFTSASLSTTVSTAQVPMHLGSDGISIAFGKLCEKSGYEFGKEIFDRFGTAITNGLAKYESAGIDPNETLEELILTNHANAPLGSGDFFYIHTAFYNTKSTSANRAQFAYPYKTASSMYYRYYVSGAWSAWIEIVKKSDVLDLVYPVNSVYISYSHTSPAELFGGTWYRMQSRFLWGTTTDGTIGATAGEQTHTLTVNEMPSHTHHLKRDMSGVEIGIAGGNGSVQGNALNGTYSTVSIFGSSIGAGATGGGAAHNNMPPYVNVAIWRRTA